LEIRGKETAKIFPRFKLDSVSGCMTNNIIGAINPDFASMNV